MLKAFEYINNHPIQNLHLLYGQIIHAICDCDDGVDFDTLILSTEAKALLESERIQQNDYLYKDILSLHNLVKSDSSLKQKIKSAFINNNKIEKLCNKEDIESSYYDDFGKIVGPLLNKITVNLYNHIFNRAAITTTYGTSLASYFDALTHDNKINQCPFCGLTHLTSKYEDGRDAFDHYLPKGKYPFSSVNNENLFPMCSHCNSLNKKAKDITYNSDKRAATQRRKAFYPFDANISIKKLSIKVEIINKKINLSNIDPDKDITLTMNYTDHEEQKVQWDQVFGITKRYKGRIQEEISDWLKLLLTFYDTFKDILDAKQIIDRFISNLRMDPLIDKQFLKAPFFQALYDEGILEKTLSR